MPRKTAPVTDAELAVMRLLWQHGSLTAREIRQQLYPKGTSSDHGTVQKLLQRLESKGYVTRNRGSFAHVFRPRIDRGQYAGQQLTSLADKLTDGSLVPLIMHLVEGKKISSQERRELLKLLEESE